MSTKKTLVARFHIDVTYAPDAVIEAYKTLITHSAKANEAAYKVDFEVLVDSREDLVTSMLKAVRSEFMAHEAEIEASEKSDGFGEFLRLVTASDEDEDEAVYDEE